VSSPLVPVEISKPPWLARIERCRQRVATPSAVLTSAIVAREYALTRMGPQTKAELSQATAEGFALLLTLSAPYFLGPDLRRAGLQFLMGSVLGVVSLVAMRDTRARRKSRRRLEFEVYTLSQQRTAALAHERSERHRSLAEQIDGYNRDVRLLAAYSDTAPFRSPEVEALARRRSELVEEMRAAAGDAPPVLSPIR
jgi:hypothetical protein